MDFKVFLSYSIDPEEQAIVWRLQTLAAAHGIQLYVPSRQAPRLPSSRRPILPDDVRGAIDRSDCVLAIITHRTSPAVQQELNYAFGKAKLIIPIVQSTIADDEFLRKFPHVFIFSPADAPGKTESEVVDFLRQQQLGKQRQQAVGALIAIGLGLLLLSGISNK